MALENLGAMGLAQGNTFGYDSQEELKRKQAETQAKAAAAEPTLGQKAWDVITTPHPLVTLGRSAISEWDSNNKESIDNTFETMRSLSKGHFDAEAERLLGPNSNTTPTPMANTPPPGRELTQQGIAETQAREGSVFGGNEPAPAQTPSQATQSRKQALGSPSPQQSMQSMYGGLQERLGDISQAGQERINEQVKRAERDAGFANSFDRINNRKPIQNMFQNVSKSLGLGGDYGQLVGALVARKMDRNAKQQEMSAVDKVRANAQAQLQGNREAALKAFESQRSAFENDRAFALEQQKLAAEQANKEREIEIAKMKAQRGESGGGNLKYLEGDELAGTPSMIFDQSTGRTFSAEDINKFGSVQAAQQAQNANMTPDEYNTALNMLRSGQATPEQFKQEYGFIPSL